MAKKQEMEIIIGPSGEVSIQVSGTPGPECLEVTRELEESLGIVLQREKTGEFYQFPTEKSRVEIDTKDES